MPIFEFVDFEDLSSFFLGYNEYQTVTTSEFSVSWVNAYLKLKNTASYLQYFKCASPTITSLTGMDDADIQHFLN